MSSVQPLRDVDSPGVVHVRPVVASVPSGHVYVRHLSTEDGGGPLRLADPSHPWWPPEMLDPAWIRSHDFDVFHLHFGFDALAPEQLAGSVRALRETGRPLVQTVHDLRNPHHLDRAVHDAQLDVLIPAAAAVITLTVGAADEIRTRWGREAIVLPHPHVVPLETMSAARSMRDARARRVTYRRFRIGLHVKSLRASMAPLRLLPTLVETVRALPGAVLQVNAHRDVMEAGGPRYDAELGPALRALAVAGQIDLRVHDYLSDDDLWVYLARLDVSVLPYRFGTHSGWLEACRDLGTTVVAPSCGYYADQGPVLTYDHAEEQYDAESLAAALRTAYVERPDFGATVDERREQRLEVAAGHDLIYRSVVS